MRSVAMFLTIFFAIGGIADASVFSQSFSGTVNAGVIDTEGLFGSASSNLSGDQIDIYFSFDPSVYNTFTSCGIINNCQYYQANTAGVATFSVTINGMTYSYVSTVSDSNVTYANFPTFGQFSESLDLAPFEYAAFELRTPYSVTFAQPIGIGGGADAALSYFAAGSFNGVELIGFTPSPTPVPEPSSLLSLASMLLGLGLLRLNARL